MTLATHTTRRSEQLPREGRAIPTRSGEPWNYCGRCAAAMAWYEQVVKVFNRATGEQCAVFLWECPRYRSNEKPAHDQMSRRVYDPTLAVEHPQ